MEGVCLVELRGSDNQLIHAQRIKNLCVDAGKRSIIERLRGNDMGSTHIAFCAVGTGVSSITATDTRLDHEIYRKRISVVEGSGQQVTFKTFFNQNEANAHIREAALFGDNDVKDAGVMFSALALNRTKTAGQTLTLSWTLRLP